MSRRPYRKLPEEEKRVVVGISISGERLKAFRRQYELDYGYKPTVEDIKKVSGDKAYEGIDNYSGYKGE